MSAGVPSWTVHAHALSADPRTMIKDRPIPQEPLYVIFNLGMSDSFGKVDYDHLTFPNTMSVDYVRVYQHPDKINVNCSPDDFPTATYIEQYMETYTNPNLTTWKGPKESGGFGQDFPKNSWLNQC
jgi:beta-glucanase (GH16 family)